MTLLDRCDGPECPKCGCRDSEILREPAPPAAADEDAGDDALPFVLPSTMDPDKAAAWRSRTWWDAGRAQCKHCGMTFSYRDEPAAEPRRANDDDDDDADDVDELAADVAQPARTTTCPNCGGSRYWAYKTRGPVQYRKCRDCKHRGENNKTLR